HQGSVGRQRGANAAAGGVLGKLEDIVTVERLAAAENQDRIGEVGNLRNDVQRFLGRQVGRRHQLRRRGAALDTTQVTTLGYFPEDQPRLVFFLVGWMGAISRHDCFSSTPLWLQTARCYASKIGFRQPKGP